MARASRRLGALRTLNPRISTLCRARGGGARCPPGNVQGSERAGGAPHCDALSQTHRSHTAAPLYVSATQAKPMSLSGLHSHFSLTQACGTSVAY